MCIRDSSSGVFVHAGRWRVDVAEEQELFDGRVLSGMMEFYLITLRRICAGLDLPVALGSHKLGMMIAAASDASSLRLQVQGMEHWPDIASSFKNAREALFPVIFDDARVKRKCLLLRVCATEASETLVTASRLRVHVCDHVARKGLGRDLAQKVAGLIRSALRKTRGSTWLSSSAFPQLTWTMTSGWLSWGCWWRVSLTQLVRRVFR